MKLERILQTKRSLNLKIRLLRRRRAQMRRKPDANIWYWGILKGERVFMWGRSHRLPTHMTFRPVKYHSTTGYDPERNRFTVRPIMDYGINSIGWRRDSVRYLGP